MEPREKRGRGRPSGRAYLPSKHFRPLPEDVADLDFIIRHWRCSESEAVRRLIREGAAHLRRAEARA